MVVAHFDECRQDIIPGLLFQHNIIGEHAAIPADVLKRLGEFAIFIAKPVSCVAGDIEFAVGIEGLAMSAGFIV